ncbi:MAG: MarR family transcriptional regulator [Alphaproteobacteria bacterium]|nr:MarR family transcriptional regulator [Alphaproteobacteria bacterium]
MGRPERVLIALRQIIRATDMHSKRLFRELGLSLPQAVVLKAIAELGEVTTRRISEEVSLSQATVTIILDRLEERGYAERYRSTFDRRIVHSRLTEEGRQILARAPPLLQEGFLQRFRRLPAQQQAEILDALECVAGMMKAEALARPPALSGSGRPER